MTTIPKPCFECNDARVTTFYPYIEATINMLMTLQNELKIPIPKFSLDSGGWYTAKCPYCTEEIVPSGWALEMSKV